MRCFLEASRSAFGSKERSLPPLARKVDGAGSVFSAILTMRCCFFLGTAGSLGSNEISLLLLRNIEVVLGLIRSDEPLLRKEELSVPRESGLSGRIPAFGTTGEETAAMAASRSISSSSSSSM